MPSSRTYGRDRPQTTSEELAEACNLAAGIRDATVGELGPRASLLVRVWSDRVSYPGSEEIHNRYLLTECGGIMLGKGFDSARRGKETPTLLSRPQWKSQDDIFSANATEFRLLAELRESGSLRRKATGRIDDV